MLQKIQIANYAIISNLTVHFGAGLNVITGETGAGKSILMGALGLILGHRADNSILRSDKTKCVVEAYFAAPETPFLKSFFAEHDIDYWPEMILRREINPNGKSRAFINDTPANLIQMRQLSSALVDLHQQFDALQLADASFQQTVLDAYSSNQDLLIRMKISFNVYAAVKERLTSLIHEEANAQKELEYNTYLFEELATINLQPGELEALDAEQKLLSSAEDIKATLGAIYTELNEGDNPLSQMIKSQAQKLAQYSNIEPNIKTVQERLQSLAIELQDVADELSTIEGRTIFDDERLSLVNERMTEGYRLLKKHNVKSTEELLLIFNDLKTQLDSLASLEEEKIKFEKQLSQAEKESREIAKKLHDNREKGRKPFADNVNKLLLQVGMPNARLLVQMQDSMLSATGTDDIDFLFDANNSGRLESLGKVASGGELSRLMLSVKSLVAAKLALPTLIFDEIDTGISGEAAKQVGYIMKDLSAAHQLIVISHQPQIAARAQSHLYVYKEKKAENIETAVKILAGEERIHAIAQMTGGAQPSAAALENAREMVEDGTALFKKKTPLAAK